MHHPVTVASKFFLVGSVVEAFGPIFPFFLAVFPETPARSKSARVYCS